MPVCSRISLFEKGHQNITSIFLSSDAVYSIFSLLIPEVNTFSRYQIVISILCLSLASIYICLLICPSPPDRTGACTPSFSHQGHPSVSLGLHHVIFFPPSLPIHWQSKPVWNVLSSDENLATCFSLYGCICTSLTWQVLSAFLFTMFDWFRIPTHLMWQDQGRTDH